MPIGFDDLFAVRGIREKLPRRAEGNRQSGRNHIPHEEFLNRPTMNMNDQPTPEADAEIRRLRALFPEILKNLESGACVADCSLEFLERIPNEVKLMVTELRRKCDEARAQLESERELADRLALQLKPLLIATWREKSPSKAELAMEAWKEARRKS